MQTDVSTPDLQQLVTDASVRVFEAMLSMELVPVPTEPGFPQWLERVTSFVGFAGQRINGGVHLHLGESFARQVAAAMLGMNPSEIDGEETINDSVGEICNMVTGTVKSRLCDAGFACCLTTPLIIRGSAYQLATMPGVRQQRLWFSCQDQVLVAEVHVKYNS